MTKLIFVFSNLLILSFFIFACDQDRPDRQQRSPAETAAFLKEKLNLTDMQKDQVKKILEDQHERIQELRNSRSGDRTEMRQAMRALREDTDRMIEELLTDEQKELYMQYREERMQNMRRRFNEQDE